MCYLAQDPLSLDRTERRLVGAAKRRRPVAAKQVVNASLARPMLRQPTPAGALASSFRSTPLPSPTPTATASATSDYTALGPPRRPRRRRGLADALLPLADGRLRLRHPHHTDVDPTVETLADADALIARAYAPGLRVIVDWVSNHTSDRHPVQSSRSAISAAVRPSADSSTSWPSQPRDVEACNCAARAPALAELDAVPRRHQHRR